MGQIKRSFGDNMNTKDLKSKLLKQYKYRIELHAHTSPASGCSEITPKEMVDTYKSLGYDAVTITNHFTSVSRTRKGRKRGYTYPRL